MDYDYVKLNAAHVDAMLDLQQRCWEHDRGIFMMSSRSMFERTFQFGNFALGAFAMGELVGFVTCAVHNRRSFMNLGRQFGFSDEQLDTVAHANALVVDPAHRRRGIAGQLFGRALAAFPPSVAYIMTTTDLQNQLTRRLLERWHFEYKKEVLMGDHLRAIYVLSREGVQGT